MRHRGAGARGFTLLELMIVDGWRRPIVYRVPSEHGKEFDLISSGEDKQIGTDDDILVWTLKRNVLRDEE